MAKVAIIIESDEFDDEGLRERIQGWMEDVYEINPAEFTMRMIDVPEGETPTQ